MKLTWTMRFHSLLGAMVLLAHVCQPLHAATIFGTVTGPDGPMAGAKVVAEPDGQTPVETITDEDGSYSFIVPDGHYNQIYAESLVNPSGFYS